MKAHIVPLLLLLTFQASALQLFQRSKTAAPSLRNNVSRVSSRPLSMSAPVSVSELALLKIDVEAARLEIAKNWGWILVSGFLHSIAGGMAVALPVLASASALNIISFSLFILGVFGITGIFFAEKGFKAKSFLIGVANLALSGFMSTDPLDALDLLTLCIIALTISEGAHETAFAIRNKYLAHRKWNFLSGLASIAVGVYAFLRRPFSSLVVPGFALGVNLLSLGISKIGIGLYGQSESIRFMGLDPKAI